MFLNSFAKARNGNEKNLSALDQSKPVIPAWLIWVQCIAFVVLYAVWILPHIVGFRNTALVVGAIAGLYSIFQYRDWLMRKEAIPIWLVITLFVWATAHLFFLSHDYAAQLLEYKRIWKYAAIGAVFAFGLGLSIAGEADYVTDNKKRNQITFYWGIIFFGLCAPVLIYLLKYVFTKYGMGWDPNIPAYLKIGYVSQDYYIPKTDYVAFCLPPMAIALGQAQYLLKSSTYTRARQFWLLLIYFAISVATVFLFYMQDIKNGMAYAVFCVSLFVITLLFGSGGGKFWQKMLFVLIGLALLLIALYPHVQKNDSWGSLVADSRIALQIDRYEHWKYAGAHGYPRNEYGKLVSVTNYDRVAWFKSGILLAGESPLGYGLIENSFVRMARAQWPEVSPNLSHSHSGWLDLILAVGFPGFAFVFIALLLPPIMYKCVAQPWQGLVIWAFAANVILWITAEVSATVTFSSLIFWVCLSAGLILPKKRNASVGAVENI